MNFTELVSEYTSETIGPLIRAIVKDVVANTTAGYDPAIYADTGVWDDAAYDDVTHDVISDQLLRDRQIHYIFDVAVSAGDVRRLLTRQVRRSLARRRRRTVIDQLLTRSCDLLATFPTDVRDGKRVWATSETALARQRPTTAELRRAAVSVRGLPKRSGRGDERAPTVYDTPTLRTLLASALRELDKPVALGDLDRLFHDLLTGWIPGVLDRGGDATRVASPRLEPDEETLVRDAAHSIYDGLDASGRVVLKMKLSGQADADVARALRVSRPTAAKLKADTWRRIAAHADGLPSHYREALIEHLSLRLHAER